MKQNLKIVFDNVLPKWNYRAIPQHATVIDWPVLSSLDGLEPEAGEPQLWFMRALLSGLTWRSGWLNRQTQAAFEDFLAPLDKLGWPIVAVLSDKQTGWEQAVAAQLPNSRHQLCQAHDLRNLATPLSEAEAALKSRVRKAVRDHVGALIAQAVPSEASATNLLRVTGLLADEPAKLSTSWEGAPGVISPERMADEVSRHLYTHTRYLLTLKGRPPLNLAGIETYERLQNVANVSLDVLTHRLDQRLIGLYQGLKTAWEPFAATYTELHQGAIWLRDISDILEPPGTDLPGADEVSGWLRGYLDTLLLRDNEPTMLSAFVHHLDKVSQRYWPGLFHCYEVPGLARTNNELESHFRDTQRRLLRPTGRKGGTRRTLHRLGAWELIESPSSESECIEALSHISDEELALERRRVTQHRQRFRFEVRSVKSADAQLDKLRQQWLAIPENTTGWLLRYCS
jgi:hypothetical protein